MRRRTQKQRTRQLMAALLLAALGMSLAACSKPETDEPDYAVQQVRIKPPAEGTDNPPDVDDIVFGIPDAPAVDALEVPRAELPVEIPEGPPETEPEMPIVVGRDESFPAQQQVGPRAKRIPLPDPQGTGAEAIPSARELLAERARTEGLRFQPAKGYWANTYVPGDPALRRLKALLLVRDRTLLASKTSVLPRLHDGARVPVRPFDPPRHAALAAYLHADRRSFDGPSRLLVQIGLRGTPRHRGRQVALAGSDELATRVVAQAVRLNVRLGPGVQLVDVIGSRRLDLVETQRVRLGEKAMDRRLQQDLGLTADRDVDDDGIQIQIPNFYADDSHVILLDVVAPEPGEIAELTVRYKDLVHLNNGTVRAHLYLPRGRTEPGPLEHNVTKSLLAYRLHRALDDASDLLAAGHYEAAEQLLTGFRDLLVGLAGEVAGLESDRDLERDLALLQEYLALFSAGKASTERVLLAESLRYAAWRKMLRL